MQVRHTKSESKQVYMTRIQKIKDANSEKEVSFMYGIIIHILVCVTFCIVLQLAVFYKNHGL